MTPDSNRTESKVGTIELKIFPAKEVRSSVSSHKSLPPLQQSVMKDDGNSLWKVPSVATTYDANNPMPHKRSDTKYERTTSIPLETVTFYYHSPRMIAILQDMEGKAQQQTEDESTLASNNEHINNSTITTTTTNNNSSSGRSNNSPKKKYAFNTLFGFSKNTKKSISSSSSTAEKEEIEIGPLVTSSSSSSKEQQTKNEVIIDE
jgi:hypothetical protein